jgi:hypothetical protein
LSDALTGSVSNLSTDFSTSFSPAFTSAPFDAESANDFVPKLRALPNHPFSKLISSPAADSTLLLSDTPATLCPEEYGINDT